MYVCHQPEQNWGTGQAQSRINGKITVYFLGVGKTANDGVRVAL